MATMRELKGRINSVRSTQKITGAMKMISSARLRKAENKWLQSNPYRLKLWEIYAHIEQSGEGFRSPLAEKREARKAAVVVFASNDGLCGAFNINLYKKLEEAVCAYRRRGIEEITVFPVGGKILSDIRHIKGIRLAEFSENFVFRGNASETKEITERLMDGFLRGEFDLVEVVYAHYKSMGTQSVQLRRFLPITLDEEEQQMVALPKTKPWYIYEPDSKCVLGMLYPLMLHALMYEMAIENKTSEEAARILAMQMAHDNAVKLLGSLQLEYNKLRQQGITTELLDIAGGSHRDD